MQESKTPTIFIILGITGDLAAKKIIPALFNLSQKGELPSLFHVVGYGRRQWTDAHVQEHVRAVLAKHGALAGPELDAFVKRFAYQEGLFETVDGYMHLAKRLGQVDAQWQACSNKLFYLSVPPEQYEGILEHLKSTGLTVPCSDETGWTRILIEKPFGKDVNTAEKLDERLGELFSEEQIYRIDHYLAKETLQNILVFRFANDLFENIWNREYIERIDIYGWETLGVETRGAFYDDLGALRDCGQNHLLQMLALITMERPTDLSAQAIRTARQMLLSQLNPLTQTEIPIQTFRAQYTGYRSIAGVQPNSETETYFKAQIILPGERWGGVPVAMEWGKRMGKVRKEVIVTFKHAQPCLCPTNEHIQNKIIFSHEPEERIVIDFLAKIPSHRYTTAPRALEFSLRGGHKRTQYVEEYEKLLLDAIEGDQTLFVSTDEIKSMWRVIDPIIEAWKAGMVPLAYYTPDTDEAVQAATSKIA